MLVHRVGVEYLWEEMCWQIWSYTCKVYWCSTCLCQKSNFGAINICSVKSAPMKYVWCNTCGPTNFVLHKVEHKLAYSDPMWWTRPTTPTRNVDGLWPGWRLAPSSQSCTIQNLWKIICASLVKKLRSYHFMWIMKL